MFSTLVMNMIYDQHVYHKWDLFIILHFLCPAQRPPVGVSWCGFIPSAVWRLSSFCFLALLCVGSLSLTRETVKTSYIFGLILGVVGRHVEGFQASQYNLAVCICASLSVYFAIHTSISACPYICQKHVHTLSVCPWVHFKHLFIHQYI